MFSFRAHIYLTVFLSEYVPPDEQDSPPASEHSDQSSISSSDEEEEEAHHYADIKTQHQGPFKSLLSKFTASGLTERMLRKTVRKGTWIYVADLDGNLFVGLKKTGTFQHSSFLSGGRVTSAGIITVRRIDARAGFAAN